MTKEKDNAKLAEARKQAKFLASELKKRGYIATHPYCICGQQLGNHDNEEHRWIMSKRR